MEDLSVYLYKSIEKIVPKSNRKEFEDNYKQSLLLLPAIELNRGITLERKLIAMRQALMDIDQRNLNNNTHTIIYNPLSAVLFKTLLKVAKQQPPPLAPKGKPASKSNVSGTTERKATKLTSGKEPSLPNTLKAANVDNVKNSVPSTLAGKRTESTANAVRPVKLPKGEKLVKVYSDLQTVLCEKKHVFESNPHVTCSDTFCTYCRSMFYNIALTKCVGHKKCVPSGWFPHIGGGLWRSQKKHHKENAVFYPMDRDDKVNELPSLAKNNSDKQSPIDWSEDSTPSLSHRSKRRHTSSMDSINDIESLPPSPENL